MFLETDNADTALIISEKYVNRFCFVEEGMSSLFSVRALLLWKPQQTSSNISHYNQYMIFKHYFKLHLLNCTHYTSCWIICNELSDIMASILGSYLQTTITLDEKPSPCAVFPFFRWSILVKALSLLLWFSIKACDCHRTEWRLYTQICRPQGPMRRSKYNFLWWWTLSAHTNAVW